MCARPCSRRDDRGLSESVQWTLLTATAVLLLIGGVQTAVVLHTRTVVANAALAGAEARATRGGTAASASDSARSVAGRSGLPSITVDSHVSATTVTVTVGTDVPALIGIGPRRVTSTATVPREP